MDVRIEAASMNDVDPVTDQWVALVDDQRQYGSHLRGEANRNAAKSLVEQYVHADGLGVARGSDGTILGFVMYHVERGMFEQDVRRGIVENVFVVPSRRSEGIGTDLMEYAEDALEAEGVDVVALSVMAENSAAREWYRENGYRPHRVTVERRLGDGET
ncbi:MAG: GNAT family N-acetyltransferase [Halanaeroarchaeum sp.]